MSGEEYLLVPSGEKHDSVRSEMFGTSPEVFGVSGVSGLLELFDTFLFGI